MSSKVHISQIIALIYGIMITDLELDLVLQKWEVFRTVSLSLSEQFG